MIEVVQSVPLGFFYVVPLFLCDLFGCIYRLGNFELIYKIGHIFALGISKFPLLSQDSGSEENSRIEMHHDSECVFCNCDRSKAIAENDFGFAIFDLHPVTNGHAVIIPIEHEWDYFSLSFSIRKGLDELLMAVREHVDDSYGPDGYNIGINNGTAAGQSIMHAHIHLIPRYLGDVEDPRGGVRWIFPRRAIYWEKR